MWAWSALGTSCAFVTGGDIPFREDYDIKHVTVAGEEEKNKGSNLKFSSLVPPTSRPEIRGVPADFSPGDFLSLNCSTSNVSWKDKNKSSSLQIFQSSVPPHLGWRVNHEDVTEFGLERSYPSNSTTYLGTTLYITTLGLQFWVKKMHFRDGKVIITIILGIFRMIIYLFPAGGFLQCFHSSDVQHVFC